MLRQQWSNKNEKIRINNHRSRGYRVRRVIGGDGVMSNYTIEDLRGKYVKAGATEAKEFLQACVDVGICWPTGDAPFAANHYPSSAFILVQHRCSNIEYANTEKWLIDNGFSKFKAKPQWTIHNNTLPLGELSDEQYGKLRRAADAGGVVELFHGFEWFAAKHCTWDADFAYRIKPKSEREAFVERFFEHYDGGTLYDDAIERMIAAAFDAGCRFVEGGK